MSHDFILPCQKNLKAFKRFTQNGVPFEMVDDKIVIAGPSWSDFNNEFTKVKDDNGQGFRFSKKLYPLYFSGEN